MPTPEKLDTHHKALTLNLDASAFGLLPKSCERKLAPVLSGGRVRDSREDRFRLRQGSERRSLWLRLALCVEAAAGGHVVQGMIRNFWRS